MQDVGITVGELMSESGEIPHLFFFLIGVQLVYSVVLASALQQSESAIHIHLPTLFWISFPFKSLQSTE